MRTGNSGELFLPALRARMGQWWYFTSVMKMADIVERVRTVREIHKAESLQELLQRQLTDRATAIAEYLITQDQRFFNSLVIGTYGGEPGWYEVSVQKAPSTLQQEVPFQLAGILGFLVLDGTERLFAIDGQHRVAGISKALESNEELGEEEVPVIFVAGVAQGRREDDPEGYERTRRLFSTLNRYAKPVNKNFIIALDEDDAVAYVTRCLVEDHPLFVGKISLARGKNIHPSDQENFTSIVALYDCLDIFLQEETKRSWNRFKRFRPSDEKLEALLSKAINLWDKYCKFFPELLEFSESLPTDKVAAKHRHASGGHLLFRPIGLLSSVYVVRDLMDSKDISVGDAVSRVSKVPTQLDHGMWRGILWNATLRRMITAPEHQKMATKLMFYAAGGDLAHLNTDENVLKSELAGLLDAEGKEIRLDRYVDADKST